MIVPKKLIDNTYQADLSGVYKDYRVVRSTQNKDQETYTLTLQWQGACPEQVANWKLSAVLDALGYTDELDQMISEYSPIVHKAWNAAPIIRRASPMILEFADRLELTDDEVDELFTEAAKISI